MDVHRSRFVPYPTSAISALAFSRPNDSGFTGPRPALKLAIGRANGSVEIWDPARGQWAQETVFVGDGKSIDGLAWTLDPDDEDSEGNVLPGQQRLFSISASPEITEWNLATGQIKRKSTGNFSEVWCFAAQPRWAPSPKTAGQDPQAQDIVAGCGDGALVLLSTADDDLQFKRFLARVSGKRSRCMCITWQNRDVVVAGFADSLIRVYDTRNGMQIRQMSLGVGIPTAVKDVIVWQLRVLPDGNIVSGDSNGEVRIWDGRHYSLIQRMTGHESDCLDLSTSSDGKTIFSGSMDGKMAIYNQRISDGGRASWARSSQRRIHAKEVKVMAAFDTRSGLSVVVSGGRDVAPVLTPLREYGKENIRFLPALPQEPKVASAPKARLLVSWWDKSISVWRVARQSTTDGVPEPQKPRKLVAKLSLDVKQHISGVAISADGKLLVASTGSDIKVFQLRKRLESDTPYINKVHLPRDFATLGARLVTFSPNGKWLAAVTPDSEVHLARFAPDDAQPKRLICLPETVELDRQHRKTAPDALKDYKRTTSRLAFAADSSVLVAGDLSGHLDSWVLEGHEDLTAPAVDKAKHDSEKASSDAGSDTSSDSSDDDDDALLVFYGQHWTDNPAGHLLPKLESAPLVLSFRPNVQKAQALTNGNPGVHSTRHNPHAHSHELPVGRHRLFVMTARHQMYELDVLAGRLSDWSRRNPTSALPENFTQIKDRTLGAVWDVTEQRERVWLYGTSWVFMLNVGTDLADPGSLQLVSKGKRKRKGGDVEDEESPKKHKITSGAGDSIERHRSLGGPESIRRIENGRIVDISLNGASREAGNEDVDDLEDDDVGLQLARLRSSGSEGEANTHDDAREEERKWWCTFKYRPILGMVALEDDGNSDSHRPLEVAVVERPVALDRQ